MVPLKYQLSHRLQRKDFVFLKDALPLDIFNSLQPYQIHLILRQLVWMLRTLLERPTKAVLVIKPQLLNHDLLELYLI